jgi:hypothetical protein
MDKDCASIKFRDVEVWKLVCNDQESCKMKRTRVYCRWEGDVLSKQTHV